MAGSGRLKARKRRKERRSAGRVHGADRQRVGVAGCSAGKAIYVQQRDCAEEVAEHAPRVIAQRPALSVVNRALRRATRPLKSLTSGIGALTSSRPDRAKVAMGLTSFSAS